MHLGPAGGVGVQVYAALAGSTSFDSVTAMAVDGSGNLYVAGTVDGNSQPKDFAGTRLTGFGGSDVLWAELDRRGPQQRGWTAGKRCRRAVT